MSDDLTERLFATARPPQPVVRGAHLFHRGDTVRMLYLVTGGAIELVRHQADGQALVLQRAGPGAVLAEASAYSGHYHCDAVATAPSQVRGIALADFHRRLDSDAALARDWAAYLAREVQATRHRSETLARRTVAARLDAWLDWHGGGLPDKGAWKGLAGELGVTPEALYREIARRRSGRT